MTISQNTPQLEAYYSNDMKAKKPNVRVAEAPLMLPKSVSISDKEVEAKINKMNTDIYEGTQKEKKNKEFNRALFFKIFGGVTLLTAGIYGVDKIRGFFKKS